MLIVEPSAITIIVDSYMRVYTLRLMRVIDALLQFRRNDMAACLHVQHLSVAARYLNDVQ